ncbi:winged helix-turn-helix transcriptional regulator [Bacillus sp. CGMCC 1.60114]|uniref:winged helix-turn-helix transcriptional regulator n=1 Tax=unclassified Bacillus (in: firmicutes) TaxID=185979 RepID=UPI00362D11C9
MKEYNFPIEATLDVVGGKWKVVLLCILLDGKKRTSEIKRAMPNITQKMLTQQLRELEADGIIDRTMYNQVPPKVEYSLSEYGKSLTTVLDYMCEWGKSHIGKQREGIDADKKI